MGTLWTGWAELPWLSRPDVVGTAVQVCDRLLHESLDTPGVSAFLRGQLPEIAAEFSAQWASIVRRAPSWQVVAEHGRRPVQQLSFRLCEESLDREAGGFSDDEGPAGWSWIVVPLEPASTRRDVLLLAGRNLTRDGLQAAMAVGRVLGCCLSHCEHQQQGAARIDRLRSILEITSTLSSARETQPLLEMIANQATRLLECERASIFLWDQEHSELVACPALGVEGNTLRLPDNTGIVGEVIRTGRSTHVENAYDDSRFDQSVDKASGYKTRDILCVPMHDGEGRLIGAFQALNNNVGGFTADDEESLRQLGVQAAVALRNARERDELIRSNQQLTEQVAQGANLVGGSPSIVALRETIKRLATTDLPVLLLGESGTGKDVVSQALHYSGPRAHRPFVAVNCAALTETLLESELFGHEKGAFTDAHEDRKGKFELAEGGTLFLDEIGDMSQSGQAKLLRVLEQKVVTRVGGAQPIPIDVRVIAATNAHLAEAVRKKRFREDLYYRLSVVTLDLPPLRERPEDIVSLAEFFLEQFSTAARRPQLELTTGARTRLQAHAWPGNVRELRNLMEQLAFLCPRDQIAADDLTFIFSPEQDTSADLWTDRRLTEATRRFQQEFIRRVIRRMDGNMSKAARRLGLHRSNLYRKMHHLGMAEGEDHVEDE